MSKDPHTQRAEATSRELQQCALRAAARVKVAREHLASALVDMEALSKALHMRHHTETAVKLALRETESAEVVTAKLVETFDQIRSNEA